jgi:uncharacterized protein with PIN domain
VSGEPKNELHRFLAEATLGKLAKWLRLLGFDTCYYRGDRLDDLDRESLQDRILLTRTRRTAERFVDHAVVYIHKDRAEDQLEEVVSALALSRKDLKPFSRCLRCNRTTRPVSREAVRGKVPDYVWQTAQQFTTCEGCKRIYWPGSHTDRALDRIRSLFSEDSPGDGMFLRYRSDRKNR